MFSVESILFKDSFSNTSNNIKVNTSKSMDELVYDAYKSEEDLKFFDTYNMLNEYNTNQKVRMLKRLNNITNNIRNKNITNSCESYIHSLEEDTNKDTNNKEKKKNIFIRFFTWIKQTLTRFFKALAATFKSFLHKVSGGKWFNDWTFKTVLNDKGMDYIKSIISKYGLTDKIVVPNVSGGVDFNSYAKVCRFFEQKVSVAASNSSSDNFKTEVLNFQKELMNIDDRLKKYAKQEKPGIVDNFSLLTNKLKFLSVRTVTGQQLIDSFNPEEIDKVTEALKSAEKYVGTSYASLNNGLEVILKTLTNDADFNVEVFNKLQEQTSIFEKINVGINKGLIETIAYTRDMIVMTNTIQNSLEMQLKRS